MSPTALPGIRWFSWLRNPTARVAVLTGVYLSVVMIAWLLLANRVPWLEKYADLRNAIAGAVFALLMLIPIGSFLRSPARLFVSGVMSWLLLSLVYALMGLFFENLHSRLDKTPFHLFVLGAAVYGLAAVVAWVASMLLAARHHPIGSSRRRS